MSAARILVVDASLNAPRIASELRKRGRVARSAQELKLARFKDPPLLEALCSHFDDPVLVTADDKMPLVHGDLIRQLGATIATLEPWERHPNLVESQTAETNDQEAYEREIVHRWAHSMQGQERGAVRRYFLAAGARSWRSRSR